MSTSNKSPYEIRLELLQMAKELLDSQFQLQMEFARKAFDVAVSANKVSLDTWTEYLPKIYSTEELMTKANEMYGFITKK